jgi:HEAT repeat protein
VRVRAARALGRLGSPVAVDALLDAVADHRSTALRVTAAQALGALGAGRAVPVLAGLVGDPAHWLAHTAAAALVAAGPRGVAALRDLTGGADPGAVAHAREALVTAGAGDR